MLFFRQLHGKLDLILSLLNASITQGTKIMAAIDDIQADVTAEDTVVASVITLLQGLSASIASAGVDPAKLAAVRSDIQAHTAALAAAVLAGTPTAPASAPPVTPEAATAAATAAAAS